MTNKIFSGNDEEMKFALSQYFNIDKEELDTLVKSWMDKSSDDICFDTSKFFNYAKEFILKKSIPQDFYIAFYHLSRRIEPPEKNIYNFEYLTSNKNDFNDFLYSHNIHINWENGQGKLYIDEKCVIAGQELHRNTALLEKRLGYRGQKDTCINGYLIKSHIYQDTYYRDLSKASEFISQIDYVYSKKIAEDFKSKSKYYCIEIIESLRNIIIDGYDEYSYNEKYVYIMQLYLLSLCHDYSSCFRYIRLDDNSNAEVNKFEIIKDTY